MRERDGQASRYPTRSVAPCGASGGRDATHCGARSSRPERQAGVREPISSRCFVSDMRRVRVPAGRWRIVGTGEAGRSSPITMPAAGRLSGGRRTAHGDDATMPAMRFSFETFALSDGVRCLPAAREALRHEAWCAPCMVVWAVSAIAGAVGSAIASVGRTYRRRGQENEKRPKRNVSCCKHESPTCQGIRFAVDCGDVSARLSVPSG